MKILITFRHMHASDPVKELIHDKLSRFDRYVQKPAEAHVILDQEKHLQVVEILVSAKGVKAQGKASTDDMYKSVDEAVNKIEKTLRRQHDKKIKSKQKNSSGKEPALV